MCSKTTQIYIRVSRIQILWFIHHRNSATIIFFDRHFERKTASSTTQPFRGSPFNCHHVSYNHSSVITSCHISSYLRHRNPFGQKPTAARANAGPCTRIKPNAGRPNSEDQQFIRPTGRAVERCAQKSSQRLQARYQRASGRQRNGPRESSCSR